MKENYMITYGIYDTGYTESFISFHHNEEEALEYAKRIARARFNGLVECNDIHFPIDVFTEESEFRRKIEMITGKYPTDYKWNGYSIWEEAVYMYENKVDDHVWYEVQRIKNPFESL